MNEIPQIVTENERNVALGGILIFFLPCFLKTKTEYVTFYMKQSFGLVLLDVIVSIITIIIVSIFPSLYFIFSIVGILFLIAFIFLAVKAYKGVKFEYPHILKYTEKLISKIEPLQKIFASR